MVFPRLFCLAVNQNSWVGDNDGAGDYVVRTSYLAQLNHQQPHLGNDLKNCWKLVKRRLPTKDELFKRNFQSPTQFWILSSFMNLSVVLAVQNYGKCSGLRWFGQFGL
ncbi:hypothetical protein Lal_00007691 [Lupinus albus]|nr:hypothetical protein Lal_00007691 [Lupinus albus]